MNRLLLSFGLLACAVAAHAGGDGWLTSYDDALKASKKSGLPILADFTGSDWCPPCKALEKEVFQSGVFKKWAPGHVVLLKLDFPRYKPLPPAVAAAHQKLSSKYGIEVFPTVVFMRATGAEINRMSGYGAGGPSFWTKNAELMLKGRAMRFAPQQKTDKLVADAGFPPYVTGKTLYAKNDLRGKKAPKIEADKWLVGGAPDMKGKVVLVDLWATWCPPCRDLIPELNDLAAKFKDDVVVIGISDEKPETVTKFLKTTSAKYHVGVDPKQRVLKALDVQGIPHVLVITPDGIVRWQGFPQADEDPLTADKLKQIIDASKAAKG